MEFKTLDRNEILEYIDARLKKLSFNKRGKLYIYYKGNLVITFYPVYAGAKATIDYLIGDCEIWYQKDSITSLREGSIRFNQLVSLPETATKSILLPYKQLFYKNVDPKIWSKYEYGDLFGSDVSMSEYLSILDECLFPLLEGLTKWETHKKIKKEISSIWPQCKYNEVHIALYEKNFIQMQEIYQGTKKYYELYPAMNEAMKKDLEKLASYVELLENKQWDAIDEILYNDSIKMKALLKKYNIKEAP